MTDPATTIREAEANSIYGMFSGGHDSLCAAALASLHPLFAGAIHINTGIGIEETREFVRDTCERHFWPLHEIHAPEGKYEQMVLETRRLPRRPPVPQQHAVLPQAATATAVAESQHEGPRRTRHRDPQTRVGQKDGCRDQCPLPP